MNHRVVCSIAAALGLLRAFVEESADKWATTAAPPYAASGRLDSAPWEGLYLEEAY